jgi:hypothetical protein
MLQARLGYDPMNRPEHRTLWSGKAGFAHVASRYCPKARYGRPTRHGKAHDPKRTGRRDKAFALLSFLKTKGLSQAKPSLGEV